MSDHEYGIFLPIGNGGWLVSDTAPHPDGSYAYNKKSAILAEEAGMDFVMSMAKWRGFGGSTDHWGRSLESITMMTGIAEATERVKVWATVHANVHHPAIAAKMFVTLQQVAEGRAGMNIVSGAYADEFQQMGIWDADMSKDARYRMVDEWTEAVTRLWTEDSVTMDGEFFTLTDCESRPHPENPLTIISAGSSALGRDFQARRSDGAFLSGSTMEELRTASRDVHDRAAAAGRDVKTYGMLTVVLADTDAAAEKRVTDIGVGVDREALANMRLSWGMPADRVSSWTESATGIDAFQTPYVFGSPDTVIGHINTVVEGAELDGIMLIFPDYLEDIPPFGESVLPVLRAQDASSEVSA
ncbi:LLM class flavin-dependent oxidoreductase [Glaciihabitans sp. dw_435]|uniref:LLM class flavin-dependent oxidoreductase n=1 Tax=Glaciihabitans sp. dw_435 TaxID=2720081 RepID=UPI001BD50CE4|nr:LLM class flavin-dependent oxidoreductase [Glaciihabitans sp. dw_435]